MSAAAGAMVAAVTSALASARAAATHNASRTVSSSEAARIARVRSRSAGVRVGGIAGITNPPRALSMTCATALEA